MEGREGEVGRMEEGTRKEEGWESKVHGIRTLEEEK